MDKRLTSISTGLPRGMTVALKKFDSSIFQFLFGQWPGDCFFQN